MKKLLICFAVKEEAQGFEISNFKSQISNSELRVLVTGMGRRNAERSLRQALAREPFDLVLTCGFAGGLQPGLKTGTVVYEIQNPERISQKQTKETKGETTCSSGRESALSPSSGHPNVVTPVDQSRLTSAATVQEDSSFSSLASVLSRFGAVPARFHCAERVATTVREKQELRARTGADAVEMESGAIGDVCRELGLPCATVRVILDTAEEDVPLDFNALMTPDLRLDGRKLALALARAPWKIGGLLKLQKQSKAAARELGKTLEQLLLTTKEQRNKAETEK